MYKLISLVVVTGAAVVATVPVMAQQKARVSPHEVSTWTVDGNRITIFYGRPYSKDPKDANNIRKIWGTVVPYGKPWRTGANEATTFISQKPIVVGEKTIPGGVAFTLYTLPMENGATKLIFNKELGQGGEQYDEKQDLVRIDMKKEPLDKRVDQFTIAIDNNPSGGGAMLRLMWENTQLSVPISVVPGKNDVKK
jgi:Protein of unknown function (DUF2911)